MKKIILILAGLAFLTGSVQAAASPTPAGYKTPTPTPTPVPLMPEFQDEVDVNAWCEFTDGSGLELTFTCHRTKSALSVPPYYTLYITDILWNCQSETTADIRWNTESSIYIDSVRFGNTSQGKCVQFMTPAYSPTLADVPKLHLNTSSAGVVYIHGVIR